MIISRNFNYTVLGRHNDTREKIRKIYLEFNENDREIERKRVNIKINTLKSSHSTIVYTIVALIVPSITDIYLKIFEENNWILVILVIYVFVVGLGLIALNEYKNQQLINYYIAQSILEEL